MCGCLCIYNLSNQEACYWLVSPLRYSDDCASTTVLCWHHFYWLDFHFFLGHILMRPTGICSTIARYQPVTAQFSGSFLKLISVYACLRMLSVTDLFTFSIKPIWQTAVIWIFAVYSLAVDYLHPLICLGHSTADATSVWEV